MRPLLALALWAGARRSGVSIGMLPGTRVDRDLAYGLDPEQCVDVYFPAQSPAGPIIVLVHGGAWATGDKAAPAVVDHKVSHWLPMGAIVVSVNYRLLPRAAPLEQARDVASAVAFVQQHAVEWGADPQRIALIGHSTGAHLAALLAADTELRAAQGAAPWRATILVDSAALDVVQVMSGMHRPLYDAAFGAEPRYWRQVSPFHQLRAAPAPLLLVHSSARPESGRQAQRFADAVAARGGRADVLPVAMSHAELNAQLGRDSDYSARVDAFMRSVGLL
jgi:arylformamidase